MFVWHHLVANQIYSWPLVTGTDLPPCWPLKEPIPNDLGKRQPLAVTRGRWWLVATDLYRHLHWQETSIILFKSIIDGTVCQCEVSFSQGSRCLTNHSHPTPFHMASLDILVSKLTFSGAVLKTLVKFIYLFINAASQPI